MAKIRRAIALLSRIERRTVKLIDNVRLQPYFALRESGWLDSCGKLGAAGFLDAAVVNWLGHPSSFSFETATDWENRSWHAPSRFSPASGLI